MPRKKVPDEQPDQQAAVEQAVAEEPPAAPEAVPAEAPAPQVSGANQNGSHRPIASWKVMSDSTTSLELACWSNLMDGRNGQYEQLTFTFTRSYKSDRGWQKGGSLRAHDLAVLKWLLDQAHSFALSRRADIHLPV